jgi:hypothetical protein
MKRIVFVDDEERIRFSTGFGTSFGSSGATDHSGLPDPRLPRTPGQPRPNIRGTSRKVADRGAFSNPGA